MTKNKGNANIIELLHEVETPVSRLTNEVRGQITLLKSDRIEAGLYSCKVAFYFTLNDDFKRKGVNSYR